MDESNSWNCLQFYEWHIFQMFSQLQSRKSDLKWFDLIATVLLQIRKIFSWSEVVCGHITFRQWIHYSWIAEWQIKPITLPLTPHWLWVRHLFLRQETSAYIFWKLKKMPWDTARVLGYKKNLHSRNMDVRINN